MHDIYKATSKYPAHIQLLHGHEIEIVDYYKHLGLWVDASLPFNLLWLLYCPQQFCDYTVPVKSQLCGIQEFNTKRMKGKHSEEHTFWG